MILDLSIMLIQSLRCMKVCAKLAKVRMKVFFITMFEDYYCIDSNLNYCNIYLRWSREAGKFVQSFSPNTDWWSCRWWGWSTGQRWWGGSWFKLLVCWSCLPRDFSHWLWFLSLKGIQHNNSRLCDEITRSWCISTSASATYRSLLWNFFNFFLINTTFWFWFRWLRCCFWFELFSWAVPILIN